MSSDESGQTLVLRPAAVLAHRAAALVVAELDRLDVGRGGLWSATSGLWQRYDRAWNGPGGGRGDAELVGSVGVIYDSPNRNQITIYRVIVTPVGELAGWTVERLCDDALSWVGLTLAGCPRAELGTIPRADPFRRSAG
jgi:hypothetical protein